jgi:hypothetical protein
MEGDEDRNDGLNALVSTHPNNTVESIMGYRIQ